MCLLRPGHDQPSGDDHPSVTAQIFRGTILINLKRILALSSFALFSAAAPNAHAMLPTCQSASSDSDGDGYGWENNSSCIVGATTTASAGSSSGTGSSSGSGLPVCASASSDPDGDGFGWENNNSCRVASTVATPANTFSTAPASTGRSACVSASSDPDGDGFGWENGNTCLVTAGTASDNSIATSDDIASDNSSSEPASVGHPACVSATSDPDGDGFGWENNDTCLVTASSGAGGDADNVPSEPETPDDSVTDSGTASDDGDDSGDNVAIVTPGSGGAVTRTTSLPTVASKIVTTTATSGDLFATEQVGNFTLMQNAWRSSRAAPGYPWSQSIQTNTNGAPVSWTYDWGPGVPGANGRASDDFYVRSYPELIFGIKDEFRTSAPKSEIGFPVRVDEMPTTQIDFSYNAPEFGAERTVDASVTDRFPNGSTISGERNVAVESFLYEPTNGVCDDNLNVDRSNGSNHTYEVMVWLDSGAERLPASSSDFVTTISLRGASYNVYTKTSDSRYIAFVAQNPVTSNTIYWNDYMDWARQNAHRVEALFGANSNSVQIQDSWCVANIIVGTEIFWGAGNFDLYEWTITQQ